MFIGHIKSSVQSVMTHTPETQKAESAGLTMSVKNIDRKKYGGLRPKPPLFPRHNNPEVYIINNKYIRHMYIYIYININEFLCG